MCYTAARTLYGHVECTPTIAHTRTPLCSTRTHLITLETVPFFAARIRAQLHTCTHILQRLRRENPGTRHAHRVALDGTPRQICYAFRSRIWHIILYMEPTYFFDEICVRDPDCLWPHMWMCVWVCVQPNGVQYSDNARRLKMKNEEI